MPPESPALSAESSTRSVRTPHSPARGAYPSCSRRPLMMGVTRYSRVPKKARPPMKKLVPIDTAGGNGSIRFTSPYVAPLAAPSTPDAITAFATNSGAPGSTLNSGCARVAGAPVALELGALGVLGPAEAGSDDMAGAFCCYGRSSSKVD